MNIFATDPVATETPLVSTIPPDAGTFTVRRDDDGTNEGIVVFYEISGTASNGVDYQLLSGHVALPAGVSSAEIVVAPIDDLIAEGTESVVVTLIPQCPQCLFSFPPCLPSANGNELFSDGSLIAALSCYCAITMNRRSCRWSISSRATRLLRKARGSGG